MIDLRHFGAGHLAVQEDIRVFTSDDPRHRNPVAIRDTIRNTEWLTEEQITSICNGASGKELYSWLTDKCPRLNQWHSDDPFEGSESRNRRFWDQMSSAGLTDPQQVAYSLKYEYNLRLNKIARRMGIHHSTAQAHIHTAEKKMNPKANIQNRQAREMADRLHEKRRY